MTSRGCSNVQLPKVGRISAMVIAGLSMRLQIMLCGAPKPEPLGVRSVPTLGEPGPGLKVWIKRAAKENEDDRDQGPRAGG